jgi:hypothetical protein
LHGSEHQLGTPFFYELGVRNALEIYREQLGIEIASGRVA